MLMNIVFVSATASTALGQAECNFIGAPLATTGDISPADPDQTSRLFRDGRGSTCQSLRPATTSGGTYDFDQYTFTNDTGGPICVFVDLDASGCGVATNQISMAAYLGSYNPAAITTNIIGDPGLSTGQNFANSMSFSVPAGGTYVIVVHNLNAGTSCASYTFRRYISNNCRNAGYDVSNNGTADLAIFHPAAQAVFQTFSLPDTSTTVIPLGVAGDIPVPGDYTGDETTDNAVFRPSNGTWYTSTNPATNYGARQWGISGDIPVQGDYDRDGITDLAVYRPSNNNWYILRSSTSSFTQFVFGSPGDKPVVADYDGDGRMDPGIFRPSNGLWTTLSSAGNYISFANQMIWGVSTDLPVPSDYDGDGKADIAVFRPSEGNWYIFRSSLTTGQTQVIKWGQSGDVPQPADYDFDRKSDTAVYRPADSTWWLNRSTAGFYATRFGEPGDTPVTAPNIIQ